MVRSSAQCQTEAQPCGATNCANNGRVDRNQAIRPWSSSKPSNPRIRALTARWLSNKLNSSTTLPCAFCCPYKRALHYSQVTLPLRVFTTSAQSVLGTSARVLHYCAISPRRFSPCLFPFTHHRPLVVHHTLFVQGSSTPLHTSQGCLSASSHLCHTHTPCCIAPACAILLLNTLSLHRLCSVTSCHA